MKMYALYLGNVFQGFLQGDRFPRECYKFTRDIDDWNKDNLLPGRTFDCAVDAQEEVVSKYPDVCKPLLRWVEQK
jgi:hypothetical protein